MFLPTQTQSGMAAISMGALDTARKMAATNVQLLAEAVRQGYHVVTTEPAAALCLTHEYLNLLDDDDTRLVAAEHERSLFLSLETASGRPIGTGFEAGQRDAGIPPALPPAGTESGYARLQSAAADSRA